MNLLPIHKIVLSLFIFVAIALYATFHIEPLSASDSGFTIKTNTYSLLNMYQKDFDWNPIKNGSWGITGFRNDSFIFVGYKLEPHTLYTLINYVDPWPGSVICLKEGATYENGTLILLGSKNLSGSGKIWLVPSDNVDCSKGIMTQFNQSHILFENRLI